MTLVVDGLAWLTDVSHWGGTGGIWTRLGQHLALSLFVLVLAAAIAVPLGVFIGHTGRGRWLVTTVTGAARALPTLGLLTLLGLWLGIGLRAPLLALVVLAAPVLLAGAYAGVEGVDRQTVDAARAVGMTEGQIVRQVELPLAAPILVGALRNATLQVVATATVAAYIADSGLGRFLFAGLKSRDYPQMLGGALLVIGLALLLDGLLALLQRTARTVALPASVPATRATALSGGTPHPLAEGTP